MFFMMQNFHSMFSLELLALIAGVFLLIFIANQTKVKSALASIVAWFVIIFTLILIICTGIQTIRYWNMPYGKNCRCMEMMEIQETIEEK
jgi:hypothetical protein